LGGDAVDDERMEMMMMAMSQKTKNLGMIYWTLSQEVVFLPCAGSMVGWMGDDDGGGDDDDAHGDWREEWVSFG
jgi:hypothetical protein